MKSSIRQRRHRLWLVVAAGWLAFGGLLLLGAPGARQDTTRAHGHGEAVHLREGAPTIADGWITTKIKATYAYSRWIDGSGIKVYTIDGVVKLSGSTDSNAERELAIELAQSISGVHAVDASGLKVG